ncbi:MAG: primosomal protein N' [Gammaproteobacteria bacterium]|nr:primosomal protein N' [Gammaproteobacteria bacterium]
MAVPRPLRRLFDYRVPDGMATPAVGARVRVPFGRSHIVGVVAELADTSTHDLKPLAEILDDSAVLTEDLLTLAHWLCDYYHHPLGEVFATLLPAAARHGRPAEPRYAQRWRVKDATVPLGRAPKQLETLRAIEAEGGSVAADMLDTLGLGRHALRALVTKGVLTIDNVSPQYRSTQSPLELNPEQADAVAAITDSLNEHATHLLDGVTSSGKTEVYMHVIETVLRRGQQALVLVPEIALTLQTVRRFQARFGAAATLHSAATDAARFDTWIKCKSGEHKILIGTRSAVLAPFANLGIIVVDEEHDTSYKQQDGLRYSARDVAVKRGQLLNVPVVLGSATPSLESIANVNRRRYGHLRLTQRAAGARMPTYNIIDIRGLSLRDGISEPLLRVIGQHLARDAQVLIFINRRGYAPTMLCGQCGWFARCEACDVRLTLHQTPVELRCHHCARLYQVPSQCPDCASTALIPLGTGTQRAEERLNALFPDTPLYRINRDTTRSQRRMNLQFDAINRGARAILVGTQMLAKGHHLPAVTLVAVLDADTGFLSPDFRAPERTAQLIVQVAGRAGRAQRAGEVWIQTFDPTNPNLTALIDGGYDTFADIQSGQRKAAALPPYAAMAMLRAEGVREQAVQALINQLARAAASQPVDVLGPAPATIARKANRYRYQCALLAARRRDVHRALAAVVRATADKSIDMPRDVRWSIDVDPVEAW